MLCSRFAFLLCKVLSAIGPWTIEQTLVIRSARPVNILVTTFVLVVREIRGGFLI
jgi:hypothetical protein